MYYNGFTQFQISSKFCFLILVTGINSEFTSTIWQKIRIFCIMIGNNYVQIFLTRTCMMFESYMHNFFPFWPFSLMCLIVQLIFWGRYRIFRTVWPRRYFSSERNVGVIPWCVWIISPGIIHPICPSLINRSYCLRNKQGSH